MIVKKAAVIRNNDLKVCLECPHCGHREETYGYNDANWWNNVVQTMECPACGKTNSQPGMWIENTHEVCE